MKDIQGFEGRYAITEEGKVWSYPNRRNSLNGAWLNPYKAKSTQGRTAARYVWAVSLFDDTGKRFVRQIHRLVASAFVPNPMSKPLVNHIDGNTLNPHKDNLEWVTNKENSCHAFKTGLIQKPLTAGEVAELRKICIFHSCRKIAFAYGLHPATIWDINNRRRYAEVP